MKSKVLCYICFKNKTYSHWNTIYNNKIKLYSCSNCNHGFLYPYFSEKELNQFYKTEYRKIFYDQTPLFDTRKYVKKMLIQKGQWEHSNIWSEYILKKHSNLKSVMDFGSGFGPFIDNLYEKSREKIKIYAVEPDLKNRNLGQYNDQINFVDNLDEITKKNIRFDAVTIFHTFEHIVNPIKLLSKFKKLINNNGRIYIEVPNGEGNWTKKNFIHLAHPQIFSKKSLTLAANLSGFDVVSYFNPVDGIEKGENLSIELKLKINKNFKKFNFKNELSLNKKFSSAEWNKLDKLKFFVKNVLMKIFPLRIIGFLTRLIRKFRKLI